MAKVTTSVPIIRIDMAPMILVDVDRYRTISAVAENRSTIYSLR